MKDKEKQIREIKKICCWNKNGKCLANCGVEDKCDLNCNFGKSALKLLSEGYRKLPEDSVVLNVKELEDTCNKCHWITDYKILKHHEEEVIKLCEQEVKQASKETAEKILNEIYTVLWDEKTPIENSFVNLDVKIREIAKQFGVEIKE